VQISFTITTSELPKTLSFSLHPFFPTMALYLMLFANCYDSHTARSEMMNRRH
jgi:hypothetical protein